MDLKKYIQELFLPYRKELAFILLLSVVSIIGLSIDLYSIAILPFAVLFILLLLFNFQVGLYITAFILPFSLNTRFSSLGVTLNTPLEPFLFILTLSTFYHIGFKGLSIKKIFHPISILVSLLWLCFFISSCFSTAPEVSLRIVLQTFAFIIPAFWGTLFISQTDPDFPGKLLKTALFSFSILAFLNFFKHAQHGFSRANAWDIPNPYYTDHTIYATMAAFMIPLAFVLMVWYAQKNMNKFLFYLFLFIVCFSALMLSYSRGALLSVLIAFALYAFIRLKLNWIFTVAVLLLISITALMYKNDIYMSLKRNRTESKTKKTNIGNQLKSVTNVTNDVSNLERINRWSSAFRMIEEKPFLGFGYGMYQHTYFAYQKEKEMTTISIRNPQPKYAAGTGGTTHSEYLLYASENGIHTSIIYIFILAGAIAYTFKNVHYTSSYDYNYYLTLGIGMSITTYIIHSFFNNFLDTAKISFIFYAMLAFIVNMNIVTKTTYLKNN